jgi:hypothetical protein
MRRWHGSWLPICPTPAAVFCRRARRTSRQPPDALLRDLLSSDGWELDEPWTPLQRALTEPVEDPAVRIEVAGAARASERTAVHRAAFPRSTFTDERWHSMAAGPAYADARCLLAYDDSGVAVAAVTVWSAGPGRPGLLASRCGVHRRQARPRIRPRGRPKRGSCTAGARPRRVRSSARRPPMWQAWRPTKRRASDHSPNDGISAATSSRDGAVLQHRGGPHRQPRAQAAGFWHATRTGAAPIRDIMSSSPRQVLPRCPPDESTDVPRDDCPARGACRQHGCWPLCGKFWEPGDA